MTLEEAVKEFEADFDKVVEFSPFQERADCAPGGNNRYFVVTSTGPKREGDPSGSCATEDEAIGAWLKAVRAQHRKIPGKVLFWRSRPELAKGRHRAKGDKRRPMGRQIGPIRFYVYSRWTAGEMAHAR
jgi:hypothetical protein